MIAYQFENHSLTLLQNPTEGRSGWGCGAEVQTSYGKQQNKTTKEQKSQKEYQSQTVRRSLGLTVSHKQCFQFTTKQGKHWASQTRDSLHSGAYENSEP